MLAAGTLACLIGATAGCGGQGAAGVMAPTAGSSPAAAAASAPAPSGGAGAPAASTPAAATTTSASSPPAATVLVPPPIHQWPIPYGAARRSEMAAYSLRHYGEHTYRLKNPKVIVEHYTETAGASEAFNTFAPDVPDSEFHELPNTCAHFLVEPSGRIDQLVPLAIRCRHTTGLNWTAIGIENVGFSDQAILGDRRQLRASLLLTRWLQCLYRIAPRNVIGHNESLSSPYHHDLVPAFQHQTHSDWNHADMNTYRGLLSRLPCPLAPAG